MQLLRIIGFAGCLATTLLDAALVKADECDGLKPRGGQTSEEIMSGEFGAEVEGLLRRIAGAKIKTAGEYRSTVVDTLKDYDQADVLFIVERAIYLACIRPDSGIDVDALVNSMLQQPQSSASEPAGKQNYYNFALSCHAVDEDHARVFFANGTQSDLSLDYLWKQSSAAFVFGDFFITTEGQLLAEKRDGTYRELTYPFGDGENNLVEFELPPNGHSFKPFGVSEAMPVPMLSVFWREPTARIALAVDLRGVFAMVAKPLNGLDGLLVEPSEAPTMIVFPIARCSKY
ncbi:hypothetical protein R5H30_04160 [Sulfitobacter sp. D35]|uniref:hypothetical protein n=1 Tax=Sulfitobacter sp. D35 TaxID=3083252 RepID=UPI00296E9264|nr:hypothetical protein [Sulfitobacter sp. D35]MDW4497165.1 hypothetical protein [Sulfitobacter sp. D35]